jgi:hypothetical protein
MVLPTQKESAPVFVEVQKVAVQVGGACNGIPTPLPGPMPEYWLKDRERRRNNPGYDGGMILVQDCATGERWEHGIERPIAQHVRMLVVRNPNLDPSSFPVKVWIVSRMPEVKASARLSFDATCSACGYKLRGCQCEPDEFEAKMEIPCIKCTGGRDQSVRTLHDCVKVPADLVA